MKKALYLYVCALALVACQKDDPIAEVDQEEIAGAELVFTEVMREAHGDHFHYEDIANPEIETIKFVGVDMRPPAGEHVHLIKGKIYRFELKAKDFYGRATEHTFVEKDANHFAFILGIPTGAAEVVYADQKADGSQVSVGVTGYISVLEDTDTFQVRYIMRHLNNGVKAKIDPVQDWSNTNFTQFTGANDLDLNFALHFVDGEEGH